MTPERLVAECQHDGALGALVSLLEGEQFTVDEALEAIRHCMTTLARIETLQTLGEADVRSQFTCLLCRFGGVR